MDLEVLQLRPQIANLRVFSFGFSQKLLNLTLQKTSFQALSLSRLR